MNVFREVIYLLSGPASWEPSQSSSDLCCGWTHRCELTGIDEANITDSLRRSSCACPLSVSLAHKKSHNLFIRWAKNRCFIRFKATQGEKALSLDKATLLTSRGSCACPLSVSLAHKKSHNLFIRWAKNRYFIRFKATQGEKALSLDKATLLTILR